MKRFGGGKNFLRDEKAAALLQTAVLCIIILGLVGCGVVMHTAVRIQETTAAQICAVFLVQEQAAILEERAKNGNLLAGRLPFLGATEDLTQNGKNFVVETTINQAGDDFAAEITVRYEAGGKSYVERFERVFP